MLGVLLALIISYYLASPFFFFSSLKKAFLAGDASKLESLVDFQSVRLSLKDQLAVIFARQLQQSQDTENNPFAGLTALLGPAFIDRIVDSYCTPDMIAEVVRRGGTDDLTEAGDSQFKVPNFTKLDWSQLKDFSFVAPDRFRIGSKNVNLFARLEGFSWRLYRVEVSRDVLNHSETATTAPTAIAPFPSVATDTIVGLLNSANTLTGDEFESVSTFAANLKDWFFLKSDIRWFAIPKEFADTNTLGCRVFKFQGADVGQILAKGDREVLLFLFHPRDLGAKIPKGRWAVVEGENWVGAVTEVDDCGFIVAFKGKRSDMQAYLDKKLAK